MRIFYNYLLFYIMLFCNTSWAFIQQNTITITDLEGVTTTNYPIQIGRPFIKGEIKNFPQVLVNGTAISTQANIKNRYEDGSVKFAIISFLIPTLEAYGTKIITFQNQLNGNTTPLTSSEMLHKNYNFDANIKLTKASTINASARSMLINNDYTIWNSGQIANTIILANHENLLTSGGHSISKYDIGFDEHKSFRPIFHATFWPTINKVSIRFIGEIANTESLQDIVVDNVTMRIGLTDPKIVYQLPQDKAPLKMYVASRFSRKYWAETPSKIKIDHNTAYLIATRYVSNYDLTKTIDPNNIDSTYNEWKNNNELYEYGLWAPYMPQSGQRQDIGPYPRTTTNWLYTWNDKASEVALNQAELAASWPMHFREGSSQRNGTTRFYDRNNIIEAIGKPISVIGRETLMTHMPYINSSTAATLDTDKVNIVGPWATNQWSSAPPDEYLPWYPDAAHCPDPFSLQYIVTGDYFYLEEMQFWASYHSLYYNPVQGRGPGKYGGIYGASAQIRGYAWVFRNRVRTTFLCPDDTPEKQHFTNLTNDAIALWEGQRSIRGTVHENTFLYNWGNDNSIFTPSPLKHWNVGSLGHLQDPINPETTSRAHSPWEYNFLHFALGTAKELGFKVDGIRSWFASNLIEQINDVDYNPYLITTPRIPIKNKEGAYFETWKETLIGYKENYNAELDFNQKLTWGPGNSYPHFALGAMSYLTDQPNSETAWNWVEEKVLPSTNGNPKWALLPREYNSLGVDNISLLENEIFIYPNPTTNYIKVLSKRQQNNLKLEISDLNGKIIISRTLNIDRLKAETTPLQGLRPGVYVLKLTSELGIYTKKIIMH
ncbi:conserved protein of unknown function precursor containing a type A C-terminal secretion signal [Tenacibaculum sp. 190524A02b]|uniref:T9SS type A sorting domain-containing protein n=1 Tax=Tenacibaculum vairaonense TaxID=3137860 RepID=UPI0032B2E9EC